MEINKIYNMDCIEGMKQIDAESIDAIICDPPYGTMKGYGKWDGMKKKGNRHDWDVIIPIDEMFIQFERVLRRGGALILFSQEPFTMTIRNFHVERLDFKYPMIWEKEFPGNALIAKKAPVSYFEDISVWRKNYVDTHGHPLRTYFAGLLEFIGKAKTEIVKEIGGRASHCFNVDGNQFAVCQESTYNDLILAYGLKDYEGFREYESLKHDDQEYKEQSKGNVKVVFNLPEGELSMSNILKYGHDKGTFHPTQKPLNLIRKLIKTYTDEGDVVLDACMGSGTTAVAAIKEKRNFIGFETDEFFFKKSLVRIENMRKELEIF